MRKEIFQEIEIPEGVNVEIEGKTVIAEGKNGKNLRTFKLGKIKLSKKDNKIVIGHEQSTKTEKKMINSITAHIKNMIKGSQNKFEYQLKICSSHFPISVSLKYNTILIGNFLGEKIARSAKILEGVDANIEGNLITITSSNKELAGQTAANLETATKIKKRDLRVFQDGIFMISKSGREI